MTIRNRVLRFAIAPAALIAFAAATAAPASAQYYRWGPDVPPPPPPSYGGRIHPQEIDARVRSMGFEPVAAPRPRGPLWVTHAVDRDGRPVRVLIDGYSGRVVDVLRPRSVALTPPASVPYPPDARYPNAFPPPANAPQSDYQDDDDDDDDDSFADRRLPRQYQQAPQQGPNVIPFEQRGDNRRVPAAPKSNVAKKKDTKKKNDTTAAVTPEKEKAPSPKARPQEAPKANAPKADAPKTAQTPKMPATDTTRAPDPSATGAVKKNEVPTFDAPKNQPSATPPVQPLL